MICLRVWTGVRPMGWFGSEAGDYFFVFDAVGAHSWEALCQDCGFRLPETLKVFRALAVKLLPAWEKTRAAIVLQLGPTAKELALLQDMTRVFELHTAHALSMTAR